MKNEEKKATVVLPQDLSFAVDYSCNCEKCQWMDGGKGSQIWCSYYKSYYDPSEGYRCDHFLSK